MNPDDIRNLIAGYASGSLTEAERKLLFEAALEDQELFDQLAGEHALKQLLDEPGVKARLLASLQPPPKRKLLSWVWVTASATAALISIFTAVLSRHQPPLQQVAEIRAPAAAPASVPPPFIESAQSPAPPKKGSRKALAKPQPEAEIVQAEPEPVSPKAAARPEPPVPATAPQATIQPRLSPAVVGFRALPKAATFAAIGRFAFSYAVTSDGKLRVTPQATGFLTVIATGGASQEDLATNQPVRPGALPEFDIPTGASVLTIVFSARQSAAGAALGAIGGALDPLAGAKVDPNPSPDSRLTAVIALMPR
jgi:hypothetical protein